MDNARLDDSLKHGLTRRHALQAAALGCAAMSAVSLTRPMPADAATMDQVTIAVGDEPPIFDAHKAWGTISTYFTSNVYEGLTGIDVANKLIPSLATDWTMSPDGLVYEFRLR